MRSRTVTQTYCDSLPGPVDSWSVYMDQAPHTHADTPIVSASSLVKTPLCIVKMCSMATSHIPGGNFRDVTHELTHPWVCAWPRPPGVYAYTWGGGGVGQNLGSTFVLKYIYFSLVCKRKGEWGRRLDHKKKQCSIKMGFVQNVHSMKQNSCWSKKLNKLMSVLV